MITENQDNTRIFEFFKAGTHRGMGGVDTVWEESDLDQICRNYMYQQVPAPLVLGHPLANGPAYGQVKELFQKRGVLYAVAKVGKGLIDAVRNGNYKHVSASFTKAGHGPGWKLRHIGFLGAMAPAVKGLSPLQFAESYNQPPGTVCFSGLSCFGNGTHDRIDFAEPLPPAGYVLDPVSLLKYRAIQATHADCPQLSFIECASAVERLNRERR